MDRFNIQEASEHIVKAIKDVEAAGYSVELMSCCCGERIWIADPERKEKPLEITDSVEPQGSGYVPIWRIENA